MKCQNLSFEELDQTFFGRGKKQQDEAIAICQTCEFMQKCRENADASTVTKNGKIIDGETGVFGGQVYKFGVVIR